MLRLDPNDLLALMYLKYLPSGVMPYTVTRIGASHDSQDHDAYPSALKIRRDLLMGKMPDLPEDVKNDLIGRQLFSQDHVIPLLKYSLAFDSDDPSILHYENGLADRLRKTEADTFDAWVSKPPASVTRTPESGDISMPDWRIYVPSTMTKYIRVCWQWTQSVVVF